MILKDLQVERSAIGRFAPAPTGPLHIGNIRTALINLSLVKVLILRIDDTTPTERNHQYINDIIQDLDWLNIKYKYMIQQSKNMDVYMEGIRILRKGGYVYEQDGALWFKIPERQIVKWTDKFKGEIALSTQFLKPFVIKRQNGLVTYMLASVMDDIMNNVTCVIRGEDHLTNTACQILLWQALGAYIPEFGHLPMILLEDGTKCSKSTTHAPTIRQLRENHIEAQALINYLLSLSLTSPSTFDIKTLYKFNKEYLRSLSFEETSFHPDHKKNDISLTKDLWELVRHEVTVLPDYTYWWNTLRRNSRKLDTILQIPCPNEQRIQLTGKYTGPPLIALIEFCQKINRKGIVSWGYY